MTPTSAAYYEMQYRDYQNQVDDEALYQIHLEREIERVKALAENGDNDTIGAIVQYCYCDNAEELELHDLAFGSGAFDWLIDQRERAIAFIAAKNLEERQNDYDPDIY